MKSLGINKGNCASSLDPASIPALFLEKEKPLRKRLHLLHCGKHVQSGKQHCAAFCASLTLLADSGNNAGCNGGKNGRVDGGLLQGTRGCRLVDIFVLGQA